MYIVHDYIVHVDIVHMLLYIPHEQSTSSIEATTAQSMFML